MAAAAPPRPDAAAPRVSASDARPGIRRRRRGKAFAYRLPEGGGLREGQELRRIRSLASPPAYDEVWICPLPHGHIQATGRDARGRKQYRYHPEWRRSRDADKFARMCEFGRALPRIRARVRRDLDQPIGRQPGREAVLAALVRLLDTTLVRVGNDEYARDNGSFGLTTLRDRHAVVAGSTLRLRFRGKSGVPHEVAIDDPRVASIVRRCQAMPGQELFQYEDEEGNTRCVDSSDVNAYLREAAGAGFTAKDFRTWHASAHALGLLLERPPHEAPTKKRAAEILAAVACRLRNTPAVCRKSYVHPGILEAACAGCWEPPGRMRRGPRGLQRVECHLLAFLAAESA